MNNRFVWSQLRAANRSRSTVAGVLLSLTILGGCGQKGPLTLPTPQFPAPAAAPDRPAGATTPNTAPNSTPAPMPATKK